MQKNTNKESRVLKSLVQGAVYYKIGHLLTGPPRCNPSMLERKTGDLLHQHMAPIHIKVSEHKY